MAKHAILQTFYASRAWTSLRMLLINERGNRCERCHKVIARSVDLIGHHKIELTPENVRDSSISLNPSNIEIICYDCHQKEHSRFGYQTLRGVYLVYGPPLSGKTSFVREHMRRGDIVVDMDRLYAAVSMLPEYDKPDSLLSNVMAMQRTLIDNIKTRYGKWGSAWIIGGYADRYKREQLADSLGAELIFCDVSQDECLSRLALDVDRQCRQDEWRKYIAKWFMEYTA